MTVSNAPKSVATRTETSSFWGIFHRIMIAQGGTPSGGSERHHGEVGASVPKYSRKQLGTVVPAI